MRIRLSRKHPSELKADLAVCFAFETDKHPLGISSDALRRELAAEMRAVGFKGGGGDQLVWHSGGAYPSRRFLVLGLGSRRQPIEEAIRLGCARAARVAPTFAAKTLAIRLPPVAGDDSVSQARAAAEGVLLGSYLFDAYLTDPRRKSVRLRTIELSSDGPAAAVKKAVLLGEAAAQAVCLARDLVNEAPSRMNPTILANRAAKEARTAKLRCKTLGLTELKRLGTHALLAVARGSEEPPRVVHMIYRPAGKRAKKKILLVGKGVTFDSGGLNLKPSDNMLTMKMDMGGAAAVLATMTALEAVGCKAEVHALLGLVENMTGGAAYKPGDILDTWLGKTVEVGNTDAEGRLVLCDLLAYGAATLEPTHVVDVATLTGACVVALGLRAAGLFTRHDEMRDALVEAGASAGEKLWPMPMYDDYLGMLQKGPADLRNVAGRWGGAITAALFLGEFLPRDLPWAHLDIAGPAFAEEDLPEAPQGGTGASVLTLLRWLERV